MAESTQREGTLRLRLEAAGIVQGVGFRPYVYRLAQQHGLAGFVRNSPNGAIIEVEGPPPAVEAFAAALPAELPPLARIDSLTRAPLPPTGVPGFKIETSTAGESAFALVPPDICICPDCLREVMDSSDRRFFYPFANCTNCGPRYSIIQDVPYDRPKTTMADFAMCEQCRREYDDPADRRFHAQPIACAACGPHMTLAGTEDMPARDLLHHVAGRLLAGQIVAWKGLGGYQLACNARHPPAVRELRKRKRRSEKPFAVMLADVETAEKFLRVSAAERDLLLSPERPIVLLQRAAAEEWLEAVSPGCATVGVMLPSTPMHALLFQALRERGAENAVLVMTSGNLSEEPIVIDNHEAEQRLAGIADAFVHHNRRIHTRVDDSVARIMNDEVLLLRRARGYAPQPVPLRSSGAQVLASGAQQKSTLCLTKSGLALMSQHLGDLENLETLEFFQQTLDRMKQLFHLEPTAIAHDLHPGYMSTQLAMRPPAERRIAVQHHHAHIASCMAEHALEGQVIGIAWDGTGLGTDGAIWGGEFLIASYAAFQRYAHLRPVLLAGGDTAVREPWRVARAYLMDAFADLPANVAGVGSQPEEAVRIVDQMLRRRVQTVETTSCGRLFDAVATLCGLHETVSYEGQAAVALETIASGATREKYSFALDDTAVPVQIDLRPMVREIAEDLRRNTPRGEIAALFHNTLCSAAVAVCKRIAAESGLRRVCLSGGCFQNVRLLSGCISALRAEGFQVFYQQKVPANDGGISLGQAAIACEQIRLGV